MGHLACLEETRSAYRSLIGNFMKGDHLKHGHTYGDNIKCNHRKISWMWPGLNSVKGVVHAGLYRGGSADELLVYLSVIAW